MNFIYMLLFLLVGSVLWGAARWLIRSWASVETRA